MDILAQKNAAVLASFASSNVLLGFDFDGTLAPIALTPERARMRPRTRRLLAAVARRYPCVVISGRSYDDLVKRLRRLPVWYLIGNHGLEPWAGGAGIPARVHEGADHLRRALAPCPGVVVEDKTYSATVHYRRARDKRRVKAAITQAIRGLRGVRVLGGDQAINLIPAGGPNKGLALQRVRRILACDLAIYVGDDETDEDAFGSAPRDQLLAVRVGRACRSRAGYRLRTQSDIDRLLTFLLTLRPRTRRSFAVRRRAS